MSALATFSIEEFCEQAKDPALPDRLEQRFNDLSEYGSVSPQEKNSWRKSLPALAELLKKLPINGHVLIEYSMPLGTRRADCILIGADHLGQTHIIVVELKQWSQGKVRLNESFDMGWLTVDAQEPYCSDHPCEQANVYRTALEELLDFGDEKPQLHAMAYLHEYREVNDDLLRHARFDQHLNTACLLTCTNGYAEAIHLLEKLQKPSRLLEDLTSPKLRYSGSFIANFSNKLNCSALFEATPEQIETFKDIAATLDQVERPTCVIVNGIVGTGKTVLAMLLIRHFMERGKQPKYFVRSIAIRDCIKELDFYSDGSARTEYLMVDEAHRLSAGRLPGLMKGKRLVVFFVDDNQWLHPDETCRSDDICQAATKAGMHILRRSLVKQLRCQDANAYIAWVDDFFNQGQLRELASAERFEVGLVDSPEQMKELLKARATDNVTCRMVGGYCWPWHTQYKPELSHDIEIGDWRARWNANASYASWNRSAGLHEEVGAIYTVQGFEYDYVGVLIGEDLIFTDKGLRVAPSKQQYKQLKDFFEKSTLPEAKRKQDFARATRNIYYVLLTRAKKGVFIYAADPGLRQALKRVLPGSFVA